ncbi:MAG: SUMF1/EgtB/PvdO family nonheme iron enzyme [Planctomycetes bacterium]|nr:SUMF1/EgtB/PvdO family nonheme iron enzyme [Planctomycetota bacterium]
MASEEQDPKEPGLAQSTSAYELRWATPALSAEEVRRDPFLSRLSRDEQGRPMLSGIPIVRILGRGSMGPVYGGPDPELRTDVAIKVLPLEWMQQDATLKDRFLGEAQNATNLKSPYVTRILKVDLFREVPYVIMEYVRGESAEALLRTMAGRDRKGLEERFALEIVTAAARGLAAAHEQGTLHRDVKPGNLLVPKGALRKTKLADVGLAKPRLPGVLPGTPGYLAPELVQHSERPTPASDVFSMGATLYALLSGQPPFAGSDPAEILRATVSNEPEPLRDPVGFAPRAIVERCLAKDLSRRYPDGQRLLMELEALSPEPVATSRPVFALPGAPPPAGRAPRRTSWIALYVAVALAALGLLAGLYYWFGRSRTSAEGAVSAQVPKPPASGAGPLAAAPPLLEVVLDPARDLRMTFVRIEAGAFVRGDPDGERDEIPHRVTLTREFWMQTTEVTQAQWEAVMGSNPSYHKGADLPVESVTWEECQSFARRLDEKLDGKKASLPTEAEWEYASRAGRDSKWSFGSDTAALDRFAWYGRNSEGKPHPVGRKESNAWRLHDMYGNVWEWCLDWYGPYQEDSVDPTGPEGGTFRCLRGGSYGSVPEVTRSGNRDWGNPEDRDSTVGFRIVLR